MLAVSKKRLHERPAFGGHSHAFFDLMALEPPSGGLQHETDVLRGRHHRIGIVRLEIMDLGSGFLTICARYGFLEEPKILRALAQCRLQKLHFNLMETSFVIGRERLRAGKKRSDLSGWRRRLFILMSNNALDATEFFGIPLNRVVELGGQVEI